MQCVRDDVQCGQASRPGVVVGVANASLSVERGAISVLMELSGSGKSTLLRAANGLNLVTRGQVLVGDGDTIVDIGVTCDPATLRRIRRDRANSAVGVSRPFKPVGAPVLVAAGRGAHDGTRRCNPSPACRC
jgi:alpha-D-ribose 1-methylphosphonate 5-triphosphate synthase subunit PhnL